MKNIFKSFKLVIIVLICVITETSCSKQEEDKCNCGMITDQIHYPSSPGNPAYSVFYIKNNCTKKVETVYMDNKAGVYQDFQEICGY